MLPLFLNRQVSLEYTKTLSNTEIINELKNLQYNEDYLSKKKVIYIPDDTVKYCISKKDKQINMLLANLLKDHKLLGELYETNEKSVRLLVLSNPNIREFYQFTGEDKISFFNEHTYKDFIHEAPLEEIWNFYSNPAFNISDFENIFNKKGVYEPLSIDRYFEIIKAISVNPSIVSEPEPENEYGIHEDGFGFYSRNKSNGSIWNILFHLDPDEDGHATVASRILEKCFFETTGLEKPFKVEDEDLDFDINDTSKLLAKSRAETKRVILKFFEIWNVDSLIKKTKKKYHIEDIQNLRKIISTKICQKEFHHFGDFFRDHEDKYIRFGYYAIFQPTIELIDEYFAKDGKLFLEAACQNEKFFRANSEYSLSIRNKLSKLTYDNDEWGYGLNTDFKIKKRELEKTHPIYVDNSESFYHESDDLNELKSFVSKTSQELTKEISSLISKSENEDEKRTLKTKLDELDLSIKSNQSIMKNIDGLVENNKRISEKINLIELKSDKINKNHNIYIVFIIIFLIIIILFK